MYKDFRFINAGENEFYRWGKKAQAKISQFLEAKNGYYSIAYDGGNYWTIGTSFGKFGEYAKFEDAFFSVNKGGYAYAKVGTPKGDKFLEMVKKLLNDMIEKCHQGCEEE